MFLQPLFLSHNSPQQNIQKQLALNQLASYPLSLTENVSKANMTMKMIIVAVSFLLVSTIMASDNNQATVAVADPAKSKRNLRVTPDFASNRHLSTSASCEWGVKKELSLKKICSSYNVDAGFYMEVHVKIDGRPYWPMSGDDCVKNGYPRWYKDDGIYFCEIEDQSCNKIGESNTMIVEGDSHLTITMIEEDDWLSGGDDTYPAWMNKDQWCLPVVDPYKVTVYYAEKSNIKTEACFTVGGSANVSGGAGVEAEVEAKIESKTCRKFDEPNEYISYDLEVRHIASASNNVDELKNKVYDIEAAELIKIKDELKELHDKLKKVRDLDQKM